ncbi:MAG: hypothetical protein ACXADY_13895 [Candidatus Hodarchaeales archaeon]|jgi:hypothetical protein
MVETALLECQNQVKEQLVRNSMFFCLVTKEYLNDCPIKCPYFVQGTPIAMDLIYENNYEIECPHFHLIAKINSQDEQWFVCGKTGEKPEPSQCSSEIYKRNDDG